METEKTAVETIWAYYMVRLNDFNSQVTLKLGRFCLYHNTNLRAVFCCRNEKCSSLIHTNKQCSVIFTNHGLSLYSTPYAVARYCGLRLAQVVPENFIEIRNIVK